jgi:hypothetical protein
MGNEVMDQEETTTETTEAVDNEDIEAVSEKAENPDVVKRALMAEREAAKKARQRAEELAARVKEYEDRDKSDQERQAERVAELEASLTPLQAENLRLKVAMEKGLPAELIKRLEGEDREALEADADELLALVAKTRSASRGDADQGARTVGGIKQMSEAELKTLYAQGKVNEIQEARKAGRLSDLLGAH